MIKQLKKIKIQYLILIVATLLTSIPLFHSGFIETHDGHFHIARIFGTIEALQDGQFLPEIITKYGNGFGYSWNLFYPPIITYLGGFFKIFLPTYIMAMKAILVTLTFVSAIGMYQLMMEVTGNKKVAIVTAIFYIVAPYRITNMYVRLAIGEILAFAFMPILFQGLYNLFQKDGKKDYLIIIGTVGIALSHNISTLMIAMIAIVYVLINIRKLKDKKCVQKLIIDAIFVIAIISFFYVPLLQSKMATDYAVFEEGFMMTKEGIAEQVVHIKQLFSNNFQWGTSIALGQKGDGTNEMSFAIGLPIILSLLLVPFAWKKVEKGNKKYYRYCLVLGLLCLIATTGFFPWKYVPDILVMIQVPWRMLMPATFLLTIVAGMTINYEFENIKSKYIGIIIIATLLYIAPYFDCLKYVEEYNENSILEPQFSSINCANFEYLPAKARNNEMIYLQTRSKGILLLEGDGRIEEEEKDGTTMRFQIVENHSEMLKIELPYIYYIGYEVTVNGEKIETRESENGFLEIDIPNQETGKVEVKYTGTSWMKATQIVSILFTILLIPYCFKDKIVKKMKDHKNNSNK